MSRKGYKRKEPIEVFIDEPQLFEKGYKMHKNELAYSNNELAEAFSLPIDIIEKLCKNERKGTKLRVVV